MELNSKQKDLLTQAIVKEVSKIDRGHQFSRMAATEVGNIPLEDKEKMFQFIYTGPNGLRRIAAVMQEPLKERIDYYGIGRRLLEVHEVPIGDFPIYDKDIPEFASVKIAALGGPTQVEFKIKRISFPTFGLGRVYKFGYEEQQVRLYPLFDRAKERVSVSMAIAEDRIIFGLLQKASVYGPNAWVNVTSGYFSRISLTEGWRTIARNQLIPATVVMHPDKYAHILQWTSTELDQVTLNVTTETGQIGKLFGMQLLVSPKADPDAVYVTTTANKLGRIPMRKEMEIKVFDYVPKAAFMVLAWEQIGFGIHNTYGVARLEMANRVRSYTPTVPPTPNEVF